LADYRAVETAFEERKELHDDVISGIVKEVTTKGLVEEVQPPTDSEFFVPRHRPARKKTFRFAIAKHCATAATVSMHQIMPR